MILIPAKCNIVSSRGLLIPFEGKYEFMVAEDERFMNLLKGVY